MAFMKFYVGNEANASSHRDGIYIAVDTKKIFYNGSAYGGSEVDLSNYYTIAQVNGKIGTNVYTGANYISKETNLTEAVLQLDEEIKATNDNLALEHTNAEATYAKKTDLNNYLPLTGGLMKGDIVGNEGSHLQVKALAVNWSNNVDNYIGGISFYDPTGSILIGSFNYYNNAQSPSPEDNSWIGISANVRNVHGDSWRDAPGDCLFRITAKKGVYYDTHKLVDETQLTSYLTKTDARNTYQPKGSYLTSVSIATISDLNANWDALLKSNPSGHVTRWPNMSEVGSKQNLVIKLNGGTTEGTNKFTYNVTAAKSINITPSSIGAAASSHNHNASQVSGLSKVATSGSYNDLTNKPSIPSAYTLPKATTSTLGGIKVGDGLEITGDGTLNCIIDPGSGSVSWGNIQGKPSVFATNIASINDLNSGWDALLKAAPNIPSLNGYATQAWVNGRGFLTKTTADGYYQPKGNYLTSVSWSQISGKPTIPNVSAVNNPGTIVLRIDSNTIVFQSNKITFNGSAIMTIEAITTGAIDNLF